MRPGLPLPMTSIGAVVLLLGLVVGVVLGTGPGPSPVQDVREPAAEPAITNIGGDEPPMEYAPSSSSTRPRPSAATTSPPPKSKPVVTPQATPEVSVARTTAVPLPELPTLSTIPAGQGS